MSERPGTSHRYEPIALSDESPVVAEFVPEVVHETAYQSEAELERSFLGRRIAVVFTAGRWYYIW